MATVAVTGRHNNPADSCVDRRRDDRPVHTHHNRPTYIQDQISPNDSVAARRDVDGMRKCDKINRYTVLLSRTASWTEAHGSVVNSSLWL